jgi:O-antigen ligase
MPFNRRTQLFGVNRNGQKGDLAKLFCVATVVSFAVGMGIEELGGLPLVLGLAFLAFVVFAIRDFRNGVTLCILVLPLSPTILLPREMFGVAGLNPLNVILVITSGSLILVAVMHPGRLQFPSWSRYFALYIVMLFIAAVRGIFYVPSIPPYFKALGVISFDSPTGYFLDVFLKPMLAVATAFLAAVAIKNSDRPAVYLIPLFISAVILPIMIVIFVAGSDMALAELASSEARGFLSVTGMHANELGLACNMAFALALFCWFGATEKYAKWALAAAACGLAGGIMLTFSRGAYLGMLAILAYLLLTKRRFRTMALVIALLPVVSAFLPEAVVQRASTGIASKNVEDISAGRVDSIWEPLLPEVSASPVTGHGLGSVLWLDPAQRGAMLPVGHPHSAYLGTLLDTGLIGALIVFLFFRDMWRRFARLSATTDDPMWSNFFHGAIACILLLLVQGVTDDSFTPSRTQPFLWLAYGFANGLATRARAKSASVQR